MGDIPNLDDLQFNPEDALPVRLPMEGFDGGQLNVALELDHSLTATFTYEFPADAGTLRVPIELEPETVERLYRLTRMSVVRQLRDALGDLAADPELPPVTELTDKEIPRIALKPLVLEQHGRRKVRDVRASKTSTKIADDARPTGVLGQWGYLTSVLVHRVECPKVKDIRERAEQSPSWDSLTWRQGLDNRFAWFHEFLPRVAEGNLHVVMCMTCKPLGDYSRAANERGAFNNVPDEPLMARHTPSIEPRFRAYYWHRWHTMTPLRWQALAEFIAWADREVNGESIQDIPAEL